MKLSSVLLSLILSLCIFASSIAAESAAPASSSAAPYDLLIRGGKVFDGTGNPWIYADVAIKDGRVAAIGNLAGAAAARTIDATGKAVAPGFIDVHTHADTGLYSQPEAENFVRDGVTTIVTGNCGGSTLNVGTYFKNLATTGTAVNVATLVGHNSILREVKGSVKGELTAEQMEQAREIVRKAMEEGAIGLSTGLIYKPGTWSDTEEIIEMTKVAGAMGGIYATHMRSEAGGILAAIDEALRIGREANCRVQISHFKIPRGLIPGDSDTTLGKVAAARAEGQEVWIDQYPYTASSTGLSTMLPNWVFEEGNQKAREILRDPDQRQRIFDDLRDSHERTRKRTSLDYAVIASTRFRQPNLVGLNMKEAAQVFKMLKEHGDDYDWKSVPKDQWPEVSMIEQYEACIEVELRGGGGGVYHTMDEADVQNIMRHPLVSICSDSGVRRFGSGQPHPRGYGSNARVLGRYVREMNTLSLEEAIRKMTSMPATAFRMEDRGQLREGYWADVVIFDPATVTDKATFTEPHQYSEGFDAVIVNGKVVLDGTKLTGALPGAPIYGPAVKKP